MQNPDPTLGAAFMSKLFDFNEIPIKFSVRIRSFFNFLKIWDTAG
jgi:hypothetical protein